MESDRVLKLLDSVLATRDTELGCADFLDVVAAYVDLEVGGSDLGGVDSAFPHHMRLCPDCAELYRSLRGVAGLEAEGLLPSADALWAELEAMAVGPEVRHEGAVAAPRVARASVSADRDVLIPETAPGAGASSFRGRLARLATSVGALATPRLSGRAAVSAAVGSLVVLGGGWMRSENRADELQTTLYHATHAERVGFSRAGDGSWIRVLYRPESDRLLVVAGDFPQGAATKGYDCWLVDRDGKRYGAGRIDMASKDYDWWLIKAAGPARDYAAFDLTSDDDDFHLSVALEP